MAYNWNTNIRYVKGIGPAKAKVLNSIKIETVGDLLEYKPLDYIYPGVTKIKDLPTEGNVLIRAQIVTIKRLPSIMPIVSATLTDGDICSCQATWWNQIYVLQHLKRGMTVTLWGKVKNNRLQQPNFSTCGFKQEEIAGGLYGGKTEIIRGALREVFKDLEIPEWYYDTLIAKGRAGALLRTAAFKWLHFPHEKFELQLALASLKLDEFFLMQLALELRRKQTRKEKPIYNRIYYEFFTTDIMNYFPYKFTKDQNTVITDVLLDLQKHIPMHRLLHGEVGSGKTAVAFYAAMLTALNSKRALILCPTTVLAIQHYETLKGMGWDDVDLALAGNINVSINQETAKSIIIGTHAILNSPYLLKSASLIIVDEQHKFGVEQRAKLQKYGNPHVLLMSATPIPRTLAMTVFGDLDISTIKELPIKRGTVVTKWVLPGKREQMYEIIEKELTKGKQAYIIYPRIDGGEDTDNARKGFHIISDKFQEFRVDLLTGRDSPGNKSSILREFRSGQTRILVSTIIAEVGLDNPNATVMVIEGADRFGLSQLHQLRGRICRSTDTTFCFLVAETANETSIKRLEIMEQTNDGFEIAEADLRLRGPGEMFSVRQHGLPDLKFANIIDDYNMLVDAKKLATEHIDKLDQPEYVGLKKMLYIKYGQTLKLAGIA